ncbi:chorismate synthase [Oenococcus sp. UCMA 16435]|nr:chorismate synthase [Oenococcus sp. UCMA 16435]
MEYLTAGESHGPKLTGILQGIPAGLKLDITEVNAQLRARQGGYGRGERQKIEYDQVKITAGLRHQVTLGSPISLVIVNDDYANWQSLMDPVASQTDENVQLVYRPRPGHADLVGGMKYQQHDLRNVFECSSARETAMRVAIGNIAKQLLKALGINLIGYVASVGPIKADKNPLLDVSKIRKAILKNDLRIVDQSFVTDIHQLIDRTKKAGDTLGGILRVIVTNVPAGLGSYVQWQTKLDAKIAAAVMGVNAIKGVEIGDGFLAAKNPGSQVMDEIVYEKKNGFSRTSDHLGGFEGGMTNGQPIIVKAAMKPLPTLYKALKSVNVLTKETTTATIQRSDVIAIVPASIVIESVVAIELAKAILSVFDDNSLVRLKKQLADYRQELLDY